MSLFTAEVFAQSVATLSAAVIDAAKSRGKVAAEFRAIAAPAYGDSDKQSEVAQLLGAIRADITVKRESYAKYLASHDRAAEVDAFKVSVIDAVTYAGKVAGKAAGCAFKWDAKAKTYSVADLPAAGETPAPTATGKDANSAEQAADIVAAATVAPEQSKAQRLAHLDGVITGLLSAGYTLAEIEAAFHAKAGELGAKAAEEQAQTEATEPKAPALLVDKLLAEGTAPNGAKVTRAKGSKGAGKDSSSAGKADKAAA